METEFFYDKNLPQPTEVRLNELRKQFKHLLTQPQPEQRSAEWYTFREDLITASSWGSVLGNNKYSNRAKVLQEKITKHSTFRGNVATDWGQKFEEVATKIYEHRNNCKIIEFGCIKHPTIDFLGASPDGITKDGIMLEIKCPYRRTITGIPPRYYEDQVQGQLEVCKLDRCDFMECKLEEIQEDLYFVSNYENNYFYNNLGMEKGIIAVYLNRKTKKYEFEYSELGLNREQFEKWKSTVKFISNDEYINNYVFVEYTFWNLLQVSCVPIYRDQKWFAEAHLILKKFWEDVVYYRKKGIDQYKKDIQKEKDAKKKKDKEGEIFIDTSMLNFVDIVEQKIKKVEKVEKVEKCLFGTASLTQRFGLSVLSDCMFTFDKKIQKKTQKITDNDECLFSEYKKKKQCNPVKTKIKKEIDDLCLFSI